MRAMSRAAAENLGTAARRLEHYPARRRTMRRSFIVMAVAVALILSTSLPASAQTWIQLRYWSTSGQWFYGGFQPTYNSNLFGLSLRRDIAGGVWGLSFNLDRGGVTNYSAGSLGTDAYNQFWNLSLHRNFAMPNGRVSIYAGVGSLSWEGPSGGVFIPYYVRQTGFRLGADARVNIAGGPWYLVGDIGFMPRQSASQSGWTVLGTQTESASVVNWHAGVGYQVNPMVGLEAGYRGLTWTFTPTPMCGGATPCNFRWNGWYAGVNVALP
jgi:hypothetical protein